MLGHRHLRGQFLIKILMVLLPEMLAGCARAPSALAPVSWNASQIARLTWIIFGIAAIVFVVVEGALVFAALRFSRKPTEGPPSQVEGNRVLEIGWTLAPALVLLAIFAISLQPLVSLASAPAAIPGGESPPPEKLNVRVIGHQWWWEFDYPDLQINTANELHLPAGVVAEVDIESADVIHSFWVPQLGGKTDAIPGHTNHTWFQPNRTGEFHGQCAEFCGPEHALMGLQVIVEEPEQFQAWVKNQQAAVPELAGAAAQGEQTFMSRGCAACHMIQGTQAQGEVGPDLTHFASRNILAGGALQNTPQDVARWLENPQQVKPRTLMPNLNLSQEEIEQLLAFLESLK